VINLGAQASGAIKHFHNPRKNNGRYPDKLQAIINAEDTEQAYNEIRQWQDYQPTPLLSLCHIAEQLGVAELYYKDEGPRLGLGSFKALGGAYGVLQLLQQKLSEKVGTKVSFEDIRGGKYHKLTRELTVITATDGNHGRSVAWGAKLFGCSCRIYIHAEVSEERQKAMEELGAKVIRIKGNYDDSVDLAASESITHDWFIVSDTSYEGYTEIPRHIMAGYTVMVKEIISQLGQKPLPTHILLQGGVGGLAGAVSACFWEEFSDKCPRIIIVEPDRAACLMASAIAGKATSVEVTEETIMAGLSCGKVSMLAWEIIDQAADDFLVIPDDTIPDMMRLLAKGYNDGNQIVAGESAVAGLAAILAAHQDKEKFEALGLNTESRVLLIGTEGATDPAIYNNIVPQGTL